MVKFIGGAYWLRLYIFLLPMYLRRRRRWITPAVKTGRNDSGLMFRVGSRQVDVTKCSANVVEKHFFCFTYLIFLSLYLSWNGVFFGTPLVSISIYNKTLSNFSLVKKKKTLKFSLFLLLNIIYIFYKILHVQIISL
jgi:hypothetical protein